ncbi:MAG: oxygenase MpaB family protein [Mycobacterium sp.]
MPSTAAHATTPRSAGLPPRGDSRTKIWRRGEGATPAGHSTGPDGQKDYGYFGPGSVTWKVFLHPSVAPMIVLVTALLEGSHEGLQAVEINHDPVFTKSKRNQVDFDDTVKRIQRTAGVPIPMIFGDTASADVLAAHLRHYHRNMKGVIPGTDRPYDAQGPGLILFAHVTIMHAALRIYENTPAPGRLLPRRLPKAERDQFFSEVKTFAELMGADPDTVPVTSQEVAAYYDSIESEYRMVQGFVPGGMRFALSVIRNARGFGGLTAAAVAAITLVTAVPSVAVVPPKVRRHLGIPRIADPVLAMLLRVAQPAFLPFTVEPIAREISRLFIGSDGITLGENARELMEQTA